MKETDISVFVDESGNFTYPDEASRFYIVTLVIHRQEDSIADLLRKLDSSFASLKLNNLCFHAGPIIRREDGYAYMNWELRRHIFSLMMAFLRKAPIRYVSVVVDKKYVSSAQQIEVQLQKGIENALVRVAGKFSDNCCVKIYYDCGQAPITRTLQTAAMKVFGKNALLVQGVRPSAYRLFQVADLICTLLLIDSKLKAGLAMSPSEARFFGGPRTFRRIFLRQLQHKVL